MSDFVLLTDSACDIKPEILNDWGVDYINLSFRFEGEDKEYSNDEMDIKTFYDRMRKGDTAKTSAINPETFSNKFEEILSQGKDILYIAFSSGLSTTFNSARIAAGELEEKYPKQRIICVDSLCASAGQGLLVHFALQKKNAGATIEETAKFVEDNALSLCHWFTVDDLVYLKRGGRISPTVAIVGGLLGIKPVLHVDNEGKLVSVSKARGRKASLNALLDKYGELAKDTQGTVYICNADCGDDVEYLKAQFKEQYNTEVDIVTDIGPVIGAHSGPGTIAVFFLGKKR